MMRNFAGKPFSLCSRLSDRNQQET